MKLWTQWLQAVRFLRPACHRSLTFLSIGPCQGAAGPPPWLWTGRGYPVLACSNTRGGAFDLALALLRNFDVTA